MVKDRTRECQDCERLRQRIAELNSELLVLKIAAFGASHADGIKKDSPPGRQTRPARIRANALLRRLTQAQTDPRSLHFFQQSCLDVLDEAAHLFKIRARVRAHPLDLDAHILARVGEGVELDLRPSPNSLWNFLFNSSSDMRLSPQSVWLMIITLVGPEQAVGKYQRAENVLGHDAAAIADKVRIADRESQRLLKAHARVHAADDHKLALRLSGQMRQIETFFAYPRLCSMMRSIRDIAFDYKSPSWGRAVPG